MRWKGGVECDGGPVMIASVPVFKAWPGSEPLPKEQRRFLHIWGQFTAELPERFHRTEPAGHQNIEGDLKALWTDLVDVIDASWPNAAWSMDPDLIRAEVRRSDQRRLWFELAPVSEYDRSCRTSKHPEAWLHGWGSHTALFWDIEGPGQVTIGEAPDMLLLVRSWVDEDKHVDQVRQAAQGPVEWIGELQQSSDRVVIAWSQANGADIPLNIRAGTLIDGPEAEGLGYVSKLRSGPYRYGVGSIEGEGWAARWCRIERITAG